LFGFVANRIGELFPPTPWDFSLLACSGRTGQPP
jgi:hypothetical protein